MELNAIKQLLVSKNWINNTMGITYHFVNETEVIINGGMGHTYKLENNDNEIVLTLNPQTSSERFKLEIIDEENLRLTDSKKSFTLTAN